MVWPNDLWLHKARVIFYILAATVILPTSLLVATPVDEDAATAQKPAEFRCPLQRALRLVIVSILNTEEP